MNKKTDIQALIYELFVFFWTFFKLSNIENVLKDLYAIPLFQYATCRYSGNRCITTERNLNKFNDFISVQQDGRKQEGDNDQLEIKVYRVHFL